MFQRRKNFTTSVLLLILLNIGLALFIFNFIDDTETESVTTNVFNTENNQVIDTQGKNAMPTKPIADVKSINAHHSLHTTSRKSAEMVVMQRPEWKFSNNLLSKFEELTNAAENGDNKARYILARNLNYCFNSPIDKTALDIKLTQALDYSDNALIISRISEKYEYCIGIEQSQRDEFYNYSKVAANNGYVAAQEYIGTITPEFFMTSQGYQSLEREDFITTRDNFLAQQIKFLQQAAQNGSIKALTRLSHIGNAQKFSKNNNVKSAAFNQLILELTPNNEIHNRYAWLQEKLYLQLTPEEIDHAFVMSEAWLAVIKANGTLYLEDDE